MMYNKKILHILTPYQLLVLGYLIVTIIGAILLSLPISSRDHISQPFIDAIFVAASGISTTGLNVVDTGGYYSLFGQIVIMCIFQIGGLGYMTFIMFFIYLFGIRLPIITKNVALESVAGNNYKIFGKFFIAVLLFNLIFETVGSLSLTLSWMNEFSLKKAIYLGIFHSISTFCTAGFSPFSDSLMKYYNNGIINITVLILTIAGGIGFIVLYDIFNFIVKKIRKIYPRRLSLHTKIVLTVSLSVMLTGALIIFLSEKWHSSISYPEKLLLSIFQSVTASTTLGFNTMDISKMSSTSLLTLIVLMFIGASPGSTAGGIKTTTFGIIIIFIIYQIKGREININSFKREIPNSSINKAFGIFFWFIVIIIFDLMVLNITEKADFIQIFFEIVSALSNTGLSMGITSNLSIIGRLILTLTMFIGRVGPLTFVFSLAGRQKTLPYKFAQENVFVG